MYKAKEYKERKKMGMIKRIIYEIHKKMFYNDKKWYTNFNKDKQKQEWKKLNKVNGNINKNWTYIYI